MEKVLQQANSGQFPFLCIKRQPSDSIVVFIDASFALSTGTGRGGYAMFVGDSLIAWRSFRIQRKMSSTTVAELMAADAAAQAACRLQQGIHRIVDHPVSVRILTDSKPLMRQLVRKQSADPRFEGVLQTLAEFADKEGVTVDFVQTTEQWADMLTKQKPLFN